MKIKKKWGWSKKNQIRYYRRMFFNSYSTLYNIFDDEYIWGDLFEEIIYISSYMTSVNMKFYKKMSSKSIRLKNKAELKRVMFEDLDSDIFHKKVKDIKYRLF